MGRRFESDARLHLLRGKKPDSHESGFLPDLTSFWSTFGQLAVLPKLYKVTHPRKLYQVVFTDARGKKIRRHFAKFKQAKKYHRDLVSKAKIAGTSGLVLDAEMRAEYFAAKRALDGVPLLTAVRHFLRHRPVGLASTPLVDVLKSFLQDKKRSGRSPSTISALE
jgi:hypothetical protein